MTLRAMLRLWWLWLAMAAALGGALAWGHYTRLRADLAATRADLAAAQGMVTAYAEAAEIRRRSDEEQTRLREEAAALDHQLESMEGGDAPLSDYLRTAAGRLWP
ncbi:hypothetical protein SAMN05877809_1027 [Rhodobacter sp. JA431]|uniref:hypothetical protein n=1 Tax=Rhodobacter sp. JA431 TaxID=570013 RepID=UPI000BDADCEA|nr:hypothetical protein [Rhodobacter sp. JA431]SOB97640.1 hypothetical protein SAMN05877809_1027 [Rhodobacter sp. JA431]